MTRLGIVAVGLALVIGIMSGACGGGTETPATGFTPEATFVPLEEGLVPVEAGFAEANGARLYYEVYGEGEPLLLIAGSCVNHLWYAKQIPVYAEEFQVIAFDNRGMGQSSLPEGVDQTIALLADDAAALLDALGVDSAHVYGHSMGGAIAQEMALRHPEKVRSLILAGASPGGSQAVPAQEAALAASVEGCITGDITTPGVLENLFSPDYLVEHRSSFIELVHHLAPDYPAASPEAIAAQLAAAATHDAYDRLPDIAAPTLVLHGTDDPLVPVANGRILAERIPGAQLVLLQGAKHLFIVEKQVETDSAVLGFLRAHSE
jgi:3-oxoadipate enol-lactonase